MALPAASRDSFSFFLRPLALIDLVTLLPLYLHLFSGGAVSLRSVLENNRVGLAVALAVAGGRAPGPAPASATVVALVLVRMLRIL